MQRSCRRIRLYGHPPIFQQVVIVVRRGADEKPGLGARQIGRLVSGFLDCPVCGLQEQSLLWIHQRRFAWRDSEETSVELIDLSQECSPLAVCLIPFFERIAEMLTPVPAVRWDLRNQIAAVFEMFPEFRQVL